MTLDDMLQMMEIERERDKRYLAPRISDYVWYAIGKLQRALLMALDKFVRRASSATWKIQRYRAIQQDYARREKALKEAYNNGGCAR